MPLVMTYDRADLAWVDKSRRREGIRILLHDEIFPRIAARKINGYRGAELFIREDGDEVEFVTFLRFDSMDAVKEFAGADEGKPVIYPKAETLITRMEQARHYRVAT